MTLGAETNASLDKVPSVTDRLDSSGHLLINREQAAEKNPDMIIALYTAGNPDEVKDAVLKYEAAKNTTAVKRGRVLPLLLNYAEPPTPLAVDGVEKIHAFVKETR